jgi:hypothetical protein
MGTPIEHTPLHTRPGRRPCTPTRPLPTPPRSSPPPPKDVNGDGALDYTEFLATTLHSSRLEEEANMRTAFQVGHSGVNSIPGRQDLEELASHMFSPPCSVHHAPINACRAVVGVESARRSARPPGAVAGCA